MNGSPAWSERDVGGWLDRLYIAAEGAGLRDEDRRKSAEVSALLVEIARAVDRTGRAHPLTVVDAAAGKSYVGLLAAKLVLEPAGRPAQVVCIERDRALVTRTEAAIPRLACAVPITCRCAEVEDASAWPDAPAVVIGLHACGPASDQIIASAVAVSARTVLLIPCCVGAGVARVGDAERRADVMGLPRAAPVRRRFVHALIEADRVLTL